MTTRATDGKMHMYALYHIAVVFGLAAGCARLGRIATGGSFPKLDFTPRDVVDIALTMATKDMLINQANIAMLVGGAMVNALAFSGSNYLFSMLRSSGLDEERKRHDKAVEQLQAAQAEWSPKRTERLGWISEDLRHQWHAVQTFRDVNDAMREYWRILGKKT